MARPVQRVGAVLDPEGAKVIHADGHDHGPGAGVKVPGGDGPVQAPQHGPGGLRGAGPVRHRGAHLGAEQAGPVVRGLQAALLVGVVRGHEARHHAAEVLVQRRGVGGEGIAQRHDVARRGRLGRGRHRRGQGRDRHRGTGDDAEQPPAAASAGTGHCA